MRNFAIILEWLLLSSYKLSLWLAGSFSPRYPHKLWHHHAAAASLTKQNNKNRTDPHSSIFSFMLKISFLMLMRPITTKTIHNILVYAIPVEYLMASISNPLVSLWTNTFSNNGIFEKDFCLIVARRATHLSPRKISSLRK